MNVSFSTMFLEFISSDQLINYIFQIPPPKHIYKKNKAWHLLLEILHSKCPQTQTNYHAVEQTLIRLNDANTWTDASHKLMGQLHLFTASFRSHSSLLSRIQFFILSKDINPSIPAIPVPFLIISQISYLTAFSSCLPLGQVHFLVISLWSLAELSFCWCLSWISEYSLLHFQPIEVL